MQRTIRYTFALALAGLLGMSGCRDGTGPSGTIRIGLQAPLTGAFAYEGAGFEKAVRLLVEQTNAAGGIDGRQVELFIEDDQGDATAAAAGAERLLAHRPVAVIGGYNSTATEAAAEVYARSGLLHLTPSATAPQLTTRGYPRFFRVCLTDDRQALFVAELIAQRLGHRRVGVLHDGSDYSRALAEWSRSYLEARGVTVAFYDAIDPARQDFSATLAALGAAHLESVYFTGYYGQAGLLLRQAGERGLALQWLLGNASNNPEVVSIAGLEHARGAIITSEPVPSDLDSAEAARFLADFRARWGEEAESVWWVMAADAYRVIEHAIRTTGSREPGRLAQYLHEELRDFPGITGTIPGFDANGDRIGTLHRAYVITPTGTFAPFTGAKPSASSLTLFTPPVEPCDRRWRAARRRLPPRVPHPRPRWRHELRGRPRPCRREAPRTAPRASPPDGAPAESGWAAEQAFA